LLTAGNGPQNCTVNGDGSLTFATIRGEGTRLTVFNRADAANRRFELDELATNVRTTFDANGRVVSKKAKTGAATWFGWSAIYGTRCTIPSDSWVAKV
jgi:hypothetical protein